MRRGKSIGKVLKAGLMFVVVVAILGGLANVTKGFVYADEVVIFPDPNLEAAIRKAIDEPTGDIYQSDLEQLTEFSPGYADIVNLTGLEHCTSLTSLKLWHNRISDIAPLANLTNLTELDLGANEIGDVSPLADLINLTWLDLSLNYRISDISHLANLTSLIYLDLWHNQIEYISAVANLTSLEELGLQKNQISDIKPLVDNPGLGEGDVIWLGGNRLSDTSLNTYIPQLQARGVDVSYDPWPWSSCFIATAAYGTPMAQEIQILREFRDEYLLTNEVGQAFVDFYYKTSPPVAEFITEHPSLKLIVRAGLMPIVAICSIVLDIIP